MTYGSSNKRFRGEVEEEEDHIGEEPELESCSVAGEGGGGGGRSKRKRRKTRSQPSASHSFTTSTNKATSTLKFSSSSCYSPSVVLVSGLPEGCSVLELKSRFEMYGSVSRARVDGCNGFVTYRSNDSAQAAIAAAQDPEFGIVIDSQKVHVRLHVNGSQVETGITASKLLRSEKPLSKYGRSNKKLNAAASISPTTPKIIPFKGREIIAYDDLC